MKWLRVGPPQSPFFGVPQWHFPVLPFRRSAGGWPVCNTSFQRTRLTLASHSATPRGTNLARTNAYRAIRIAAKRTRLGSLRTHFCGLGEDHGDMTLASGSVITIAQFSNFCPSKVPKLTARKSAQTFLPPEQTWRQVRTQLHASIQTCAGWGWEWLQDSTCASLTSVSRRCLLLVNLVFRWHQWHSAADISIPERLCARCAPSPSLSLSLRFSLSLWESLYLQPCSAREPPSLFCAYIYIYICLSLSLSVCLSVCLSLSLSLSISLFCAYVSLSLSLSLSLCLSLSLSFSLTLALSLSQSHAFFSFFCSLSLSLSLAQSHARLHQRSWTSAPKLVSCGSSGGSNFWLQGIWMWGSGRPRENLVRKVHVIYLKFRVLFEGDASFQLRVCWSSPSLISMEGVLGLCANICQALMFIKLSVPLRSLRRSPPPKWPKRAWNTYHEMRLECPGDRAFRS